MIATDIDLPGTWSYGAGVLHGGWLLETVVAEALRHTRHVHPLAVSASFVSAPRVGAPTRVETQVLREGRSVGALRARLVQDSRSQVEVLLSAGTLPAGAPAPTVLDAIPPELPPVEACVTHEAPPGPGRNGITEQLEMALDPATAGFLTGRPGGGSEVRGWIRSRTGRQPDPLFLLTVADALPPVTVELGIPGWVPTVQLSVQVRAAPAAGWLRVAQRARLVQSGWLDEECEVWDSQGRLVAQARQLAAYRVP